MEQKRILLYHTKNYQGTTTEKAHPVLLGHIIPYQELPGNYNDIDNDAINPSHYTIPRTTRELQLGK